MTDEQQDNVLRDPAYALHCLEGVVDQVSDAFLTAHAPRQDVADLGMVVARLWNIWLAAQVVKTEAAA